MLPACLTPRTAGGREPCLIPSVLYQADPKIMTAATYVSVDDGSLFYTRGVFLLPFVREVGGAGDGSFIFINK